MNSFFRLNKIEHSYTLLADFSNAVVASLIVAGISVIYTAYRPQNHSRQLVAAGILASAASLIYALLRRIRINQYLENRFLKMQSLAAAKGYQTYSSLGQDISATKDPHIASMTLASISREANYRNFLNTSDWTYFDFSYATYRKTKYGDYKSADVYYGVMKTRLPRLLPNVFFDSRQARKRQFRFIFRRRQIYHFEGDFDQYFTTYFPNNYKIDSLSFITPDVMQALKDASGYDAEIIADELFLYGPIYDLDFQLSDMSTKLAAIRQSLQITTQNYHDDHIPAEAGWHDVADEGSHLARSRFWLYVNIAGIIIYLIVRAAVAIIQNK